MESEREQAERLKAILADRGIDAEDVWSYETGRILMRHWKKTESDAVIDCIETVWKRRQRKEQSGLLEW